MLLIKKHEMVSSDVEMNFLLFKPKTKLQCMDFHLEGFHPLWNWGLDDLKYLHHFRHGRPA